MKEKAIANITRDEIQTASNRIAKILQEKGEMRLEQLARETKFESHTLEWAIGYLICKNEVKIMRDDDYFIIRLKKPGTHAPVFI